MGHYESEMSAPSKREQLALALEREARFRAERDSARTRIESLVAENLSLQSSLAAALQDTGAATGKTVLDGEVLCQAIIEEIDNYTMLSADVLEEVTQAVARRIWPLIADALAVLGQDQAAEEGGPALALEDPECLFVGGPFGGQTQRCRAVSAIPMPDLGGIYWLDTKSDPPAYHWQAKMSFPAKCPPCESGDHPNHVEDWNVKPGLIGGASCPCRGDCKMPDLSAILGPLPVASASPVPEGGTE